MLECGPDSFLSAKPEALALIKELGLEGEVIGSNDHQRTTYILKHGRLVALPEGVMMIVPTKVMPMVKSPLLGWGTKIRMGLELLAPARTSRRTAAWRNSWSIILARRRWIIWPSRCSPASTAAIRAQLSVGERAAAFRRDGSEVREPGARGDGGKDRSGGCVRRLAVPDAEGRAGHADRRAVQRA